MKITTGISYGNDRDRSKGYCNLFGVLTNCSGKTTNISADANYVATNFKITGDIDIHDIYVLDNITYFVSVNFLMRFSF